MQHSGLNSHKLTISNLRELSAVKKRLDEVKNLLYGGCLPKQRDPLSVKGLRLFVDVLLFGKEEKVAVCRYLSALAEVLGTSN